MFGLDPRLIALFCIMFIALGIFNILNARRRMRQAQMQGAKVRWYKNIGILTGIEYVLLALAFLFSISVNYQWLPKSLSMTVLPIYFVAMIASGILAGVIIYLSLTSRTRRGVVARPVVAMQAKKSSDDDESISPQERAELAQKRRERRQKAAAARRRRAGKA